MTGIKLTDEDRKCYLYRAFLKEDPTKDYVGITVNFKKRKRDHRRDAKNGTGEVFARALAKYGFTNFEWTILSICRSRRVAADLEIFCRKFLKLGSYNLTDGGEGAEGITAESRLAKSLHMKNMWKDQDQRQHLLDGMARRWEDPEEKKYFGSVMSEVRSEPEAKEKHRKMMLAKHQEPGYSSKIGKKVSEHWAKHEYPEEARAKLSIANTGLKRTDAHIENQRKSFKKNRELGLNIDSEETRLKKSKGQKERALREAAEGGRRISEETRKKQSDAQKARFARERLNKPTI